MCSSGGSNNSAQEAQENAQQLAAQQSMATANLKQQKSIADAQTAQNQAQLDYQKQQNAAVLADTQAQAARQSTWDTARNANATAASNSVNAAFAQFTPAYYKNYQDAYTASADDEINRQYGLAQQTTAFGLARTGNLASSTAADQAGVLAETQGRAVADQANDAVTAANNLQSTTATAKANLLSQALSTNVLGQPIAGGTAASVQSAIDTSNRAITDIGNSSSSYAASIQGVTPALGTLSGIFSGALGGAANAYTGYNDAKLAAAVGGANANASSGSSSVPQMVY